MDSVIGNWFVSIATRFNDTAISRGFGIEANGGGIEGFVGDLDGFRLYEIGDKEGEIERDFVWLINDVIGVAAIRLIGCGFFGDGVISMIPGFFFLLDLKKSMMLNFEDILSVDVTRLCCWGWVAKWRMLGQSTNPKFQVKTIQVKLNFNTNHAQSFNKARRKKFFEGI